MTITPTRAPKPAERKAKDSASTAWPCLAIGWPSKVVATEDGSPGMLNRIEVVEPPNSAPQYMLVRRMMRRDRIHGEGQRHQDGDAVRRPEAGQHADQNAEQHADQHQRHVLPGERDREAVEERAEIVHAGRLQ